ncbi:hypothetical protein [Microseira wollei]|nr:hypothetical protein [Microseira wollei]
MPCPYFNLYIETRFFQKTGFLASKKSSYPVSRVAAYFSFR